MFKFLIRQLLLILSNLGDFLDFVIRTPVRWLLRQSNTKDSKQLWLRLILLPWTLTVGLFRLIVFLTSSPQRALRFLTTARKRDLLRGLPALVGTGLAVWVLLYSSLANRQIISRYRVKSQNALAAADFSKAKVYLTRVINEDRSPKQEDLYHFAESLSKTGEEQRASKIIDELAPDNAPGYPPAHRLKAANLASLIQQVKDTGLIEKLRWHLQQANDPNSTELSQLWSLYYLAVQQPENAVRHLQRAAVTKPELLLTVADIQKEAGDTGAFNQTLRKAVTVFTKRVDDEPMNLEFRVMLARVLAKQNVMPEAERVLLAGYAIGATPEFSRAIAEFYVLWHDIAVRDQLDFKLQLDLLQRSMKYDINYAPIYERLILKYRRSSEAENFEDIEAVLEEAIAQGHSTALAHFAIGNLFWLKEQFQQAEWHINQAYKLDDRLAFVGNNLAWLLAHKEQPELDQALKLAEGVVSQFPDPRFRDTLATILMKKGDLDRALVEFEKTLPLIANKQSVHQKIAEIYSAIGNETLAKLHRELMNSSPQGSN